MPLSIYNKTHGIWSLYWAHKYPQQGNITEQYDSWYSGPWL